MSTATPELSKVAVTIRKVYSANTGRRQCKSGRQRYVDVDKGGRAGAGQVGDVAVELLRQAVQCEAGPRVEVDGGVDVHVTCARLALSFLSP